MYKKMKNYIQFDINVHREDLGGGGGGIPY